MLIRRRTESDLPELIHVARQVRESDGYPVYLPDNDFTRFLTEPESLAAWVSECDSRLTGHVALNPSASSSVTTVLRNAGVEGDLGLVARLLVHPSDRRASTGAQLLDVARLHAIALGLTPVLDVVASSNPAIQLYRREGWGEVGEVTFVLPDQRSITELVFCWK
jgi:ribosomal protein S18 acetylase RimI-like enzyme